MNSSRAFRLSIAALIGLTVAWKIVVYSTAPDDLIARISSFLTRNDFVVDPPEQILNIGTSAAEASIIRATSRACNLSVAQLTIDGSNRQLIESRFAGAERRFIVFRGKLYPEPPEFAIVESFIWTRLVKELGVSNRSLPVIAVAANTSCNAEGLPWNEL